MKVWIKIDSTDNHFQFILIRSWTKMPALSTWCIMGKLDCGMGEPAESSLECFLLTRWGFTTWKQKKSSDKMLPQLSIEQVLLISLWFQAQHPPICPWANQTCAA